jgi:hypothetical protein
MTRVNSLLPSPLPHIQTYTHKHAHASYFKTCHFSGREEEGRRGRGREERERAKMYGEKEVGKEPDSHNDCFGQIEDSGRGSVGG